MKKINNRGFMIAELLIVTVAIMVIFTAIYSNFYPTMGEYEKRETYNNINSLYANFYFRSLYLKSLSTNTSLESTLINKVSSQKYVTLVSNGSCTTELNAINGFQDKCNDLVTNLGIKDVILTTYNITNVKNSYPTTGTLKNYIDYLSNANENNLYRLITKTSDGYATSNFYSKVCEPTVYTPWSDWILDTCVVANTDTCKTDNINLKIGDWGTMICDINNKLCETATLYKTKSDWNTTSCDINESSCETTSGYLKQTRTQTGTREVYMGEVITNSFGYTGGCLKGAEANAVRYRCMVGPIASIYETMDACESTCANPETCTAVTFNVCSEGYTYSGNCYCSSNEPTIVPVYSNWSDGTYETECITDTLTKCTSATIYRTVGTQWLEMCPTGENCDTTTGYRLNEMCFNPLESCCNENEKCESRTGYSNRTALTNTLDLNSSFVSACN